MARKLSVDLELNAKGYTQGINEAKNATAQYTNATVDLKKETEDYLSQFGSLRKQLRAAETEAFNLAVQFSQLSKTEKDSEIGQQMADELQFAIEKAAELKDVMSDTRDAIRNASSDTAGLDAFKALTSSAEIMSAIGQPADMSGMRTLREGLRIFAVSAMNSTPQKTITSASTSVALRASSRESPVKSAISCTSAGQ